jgi:hypothetical protein
VMFRYFGLTGKPQVLADRLWARGASAVPERMSSKLRERSAHWSARFGVVNPT